MFKNAPGDSRNPRFPRDVYGLRKMFQTGASHKRVKKLQMIVDMKVRRDAAAPQVGLEGRHLIEVAKSSLVDAGWGGEAGDVVDVGLWEAHIGSHGGMVSRRVKGKVSFPIDPSVYEAAHVTTQTQNIVHTVAGAMGGLPCGAITWHECVCCSEFEAL